METIVLKLLFEKYDNMKIVSKIIDNDKAFLYSLLKIKGCKECPSSFEIKLGMIEKEEE